MKKLSRGTLPFSCMVAPDGSAKFGDFSCKLLLVIAFRSRNADERKVDAFEYDILQKVIFAVGLVKVGGVIKLNGNHRNEVRIAQHEVEMLGFYFAEVSHICAVVLSAGGLSNIGKAHLREEIQPIVGGNFVDNRKKSSFCRREESGGVIAPLYFSGEQSFFVGEKAYEDNEKNQKYHGGNNIYNNMNIHVMYSEKNISRKLHKIMECFECQNMPI